MKDEGRRGSKGLPYPLLAAAGWYPSSFILLFLFILHPSSFILISKRPHSIHDLANPTLIAEAGVRTFAYVTKVGVGDVLR